MFLKNYHLRSKIYDSKGVEFYIIPHMTLQQQKWVIMSSANEDNLLNSSEIVKFAHSHNK